jgi:hypothetical protein
MKQVNILFTSPKKFMIGAEAIKMYQGFTKYSHVAIELSDGVCFHAAHGRVHYISKDALTEGNAIHESIPLSLTTEQYDKLILQAVILEGTVYGYDELVKIIVSDLIYTLTFKRVNPTNGKGFICSELIAELLEEAIGAKFNKPKNLITPKDINIFMKGLQK